MLETNGGATLVASLTSAPADGLLARLSPSCGVLEVRADLVGELDPDELRRGFDGKLLYTLRSEAEGGGAAEHERGARLAVAAGRYDLVDLEAERDLTKDVLDAVPAAKRVVSWHGEATDVAGLKRRFEAMSREPAVLYKLAPAASDARQALAPLALLASLDRDDVVAFATGGTGLWTRLLAPRLGARVVFGAAGDPPAAPGQPTIERLVTDYGLPALAPVEAIYGIVGDPVLHSLSPRLHNACYAASGVPALYLPFSVSVFGDFWLDLVERNSLEVLGFPLRGLSVTAPFKQVALAVSGATSPLAERVGSANTLVRRDHVWEAESTDAAGVLGPLRAAAVELDGRPCAVVGAGGAGRAAAFALAEAGARVTLVNRGADRGARVARELGVSFVPLDELDPADFELVVNGTPLGTDASGELPVDPAAIATIRGGWLVDLVYQADGPTRLARAAAEAGLGVVDGREVLFHQALRQFELMTGRPMPRDVGRRCLGLAPEAADGGG